MVPLKRRLKPLTVEELQQGGEGSRPTSARSRMSKASAATGGLGGAKKKEEKKVKKEEKKKEDKKVPEEMSTEDKLRAFLKAKNDEAQAKAKKAKAAPVVEADDEPEVRKPAAKEDAVPAKKSKLADIVADWDDE